MHANHIITAALAALRAEYSYDNGQESAGLPRLPLAPWRLADTADCGAPERDELLGASFLTSLFTDFEEQLDDMAFDADADAYDIRKELERVEWHERADSAVPIYTHQKWNTFVQLAAYDEDVSDIVHGGDVTGEAVANAALFLIAERLLMALAGELADKCDEIEQASQEQEQEQAHA